MSLPPCGPSVSLVIFTVGSDLRRVFMGNEANMKKFSWVIKKVPILESEKIYSNQFFAGDCKWRFAAYPQESGVKCLFLVLEVVDFESLPCGWRRETKCRLTIVNQLSEELSRVRETIQWYDRKSLTSPYGGMIPLSKLYAEEGGFVVNNEIKVVAEVEVLQVIGNLEVMKESEEATQPLKKAKRDADIVESQDFLSESMNVSEVLSFQVEYFSRVLRKYPDIALVLRGKNQYLRKACMLVLHSLIETLCKALEKLSKDDFVEADNSITYLKLSGVKVDWLERKLEEVKEMKKEKEISETQIRELEGGLKDFTQKCAYIESILERGKVELENLKGMRSYIATVLEEEKAKVLAVETPPLTVDDLIS